MVNELNRAIDSTNKLDRFKSSEETVTRVNCIRDERCASKKKKTKENIKAFDLMGFKKASSFSIDSFFKPNLQIQDASIVSGDPNTSTESQDTNEPGAQNISTESQDTIESQYTPASKALNINTASQNTSTESQKSNTEDEFLLSLLQKQIITQQAT